ncbi:uncharacterized protein LOC112568081 [Pomacea canaliculata]|uniref:uncharacterized protein LOC112568081 n=1 Tax=Pomacea canaliculata TaxID=400727 RepID=UPI000D7294F8|nr:uncharacterized protein LOC112568081 [Pomacea canaliculata]
MLAITSAICCFFSAVLHTVFVHGDESKCTVKSNENCSVKITCTISTTAFIEGQSFNLYHHMDEKKERIAELNYVGAFYLCHPLKGYSCRKCKDVFNITSSSCEPRGEFMFFADGEQPERCRNELRRRRESGDDRCDEDSLSENAGIQTLGFNTNKNKEDEVDKEDDAQTGGVNSLAIGLSVGGLLTAMVIVSLILILLRRNRLKQNNRNGKDVELQKSTENTNDPLLSRGCNGQPTRPEDKERNSFLSNKETSDHI